MSGLLDGIRVVDLTSVIMGPFATHILADMGADVVKVESPEGDSLRSYHPNRHENMSGQFLHLNRNKRSVVLDLKTGGGRAALDRLIETADVFVHALRPAAIRRLGFDYAHVRDIRPDIVYCGAYGFSAAGPYGDKAAYDDLIQAGSGLAAMQGQITGTPGYAATVICDKLAGQAIAYSVLAALLARARGGGGGQEIEVPMFETSIEFMLLEHLQGFAFEPPLGPPGFARMLSMHRKPYRTADGHACILPYSDRNWQDFFDFVGRPELKEDERFRRLPIRVQHIAELYRLIEEKAPERTTAEWVAFCDRASIPCMPVMSIAELPEDPHVRAVGLFGEGEHPSEGRYKVIRRPVTFGASPFELRRHAPRLGEHTQEVLAELGLAPQEKGRA